MPQTTWCHIASCYITGCCVVSPMSGVMAEVKTELLWTTNVTAAPAAQRMPTCVDDFMDDLCYMTFKEQTGAEDHQGGCEENQPHGEVRQRGGDKEMPSCRAIGWTIIRVLPHRQLGDISDTIMWGHRRHCIVSCPVVSYRIVSCRIKKYIVIMKRKGHCGTHTSLEASWTSQDCDHSYHCSHCLWTDER